MNDVVLLESCIILDFFTRLKTLFLYDLMLKRWNEIWCKRIPWDLPELFIPNRNKWRRKSSILRTIWFFLPSIIRCVTKRSTNVDFVKFGNLFHVSTKSWIDPVFHGVLPVYRLPVSSYKLYCLQKESYKTTPSYLAASTASFGSFLKRFKVVHSLP